MRRIIKFEPSERRITIIDSEDGWSVEKHETLDDGKYVADHYAINFWGNPIEMKLPAFFVEVLRDLAFPQECIHCGGEFTGDNPPAGVMCERCDNDFKEWCEGCKEEIRPVNKTVREDGKSWHAECLEKHHYSTCNSAPDIHCKACDGRGELGDETCARCEGSGEEPPFVGKGATFQPDDSDPMNRRIAEDRKAMVDQGWACPKCGRQMFGKPKGCSEHGVPEPTEKGEDSK